MAGMTAGEAYDEFMDDTFDVTGDTRIGFTTTQSDDPPAVSGNTSNTIVDSTNPVAVDAWNDYVENEAHPVSSTTGGIQDGSNVYALTYSILERTGGAPEAVATYGVPITAAIVAASQALGVSIDAAQLDVETRQAFANSIANTTGVIYDKARELVTVWKDALGNILFPKSVVEAIESVLIENGIGVTESTATSSVTGYTFGVLTNPTITATSGNYAETITFSGASTVYVFKYQPSIGSPGVYAVSLSPFKLHIHGRNSQSGSEYDIDRNSAGYGNTTISRTRFYFDSVGGNNVPGTVIANNISLEPLPANDVVGGATTIYDGTVVEGGGYPDGTSESQAPKYSSSDLTESGSIMGQDDVRVPVVPLNIPDDPYNSTGSTTDPQSPTDDDNPAVQNPPIPLPIPDTRPSNPDVPLVNPSVIDSTRVEELVEELANTLDPQPGQSSGIIPVPPLPGITDPSTGQTTFPSIIPDSGPGFIHVYNPTPAEFVAFGAWLWVTYADATIDKILNNPFDGVIGAHELYATPNRGGTDNIRSAFLVCPTTAALVPNRYSEIDCGTVIVPEFYGNYLDYSPYSQAYIYLPFIGINEVSIDDIVGHAVNIRYRVDSYSGSCIAMIFVAKDGYQNLCYQFAGSCSVEVPMAGGSQAAIKAGMMQAEAYARAAMTSAVGHLFGGIGSALMGSLGGTLSSIGGIANDYAQAKAGVEAARVANKSSVQHSGQFGASHGAMGQKVPFIIIRNPIQVKVVNYNDDYGYPAHKRVIIGGCTGYLRVREVNVISAHATDDEKSAIEAILKNGVYVS